MLVFTSTEDSITHYGDIQVALALKIVNGIDQCRDIDDITALTIKCKISKEEQRLVLNRYKLAVK
jgi:hypothetical protein